MRAGCCQCDGVGSLKSGKTMKEAYAVRRTVPPSAEIQASIDKLLGSGLVEDEFDEWLGRARYERSRPEYQRGLRNGFRPRRVQTAEGELEVEIPQVREAAQPFVSKLFGRWHY